MSLIKGLGHAASDAFGGEIEEEASSEAAKATGLSRGEEGGVSGPERSAGLEQALGGDDGLGEDSSVDDINTNGDLLSSATDGGPRASYGGLEEVPPPSSQESPDSGEVKNLIQNAYDVLGGGTSQGLGQASIGSEPESSSSIRAGQPEPLLE